MTDQFTVTLTKPIQAHGKTYTELTFREPTGRDLSRCGYPFRLTSSANGETARVFDTAAVTALIAYLTNIPPPSAEELNARDWTACMAMVASFFGDAAAETNSVSPES